MLPAGFEPAIPACERPQTDALDLAATGGSLYACAQLYSCSEGAFILTVLPPVADPDPGVHHAEFYHSVRPDVRVTLCFFLERANFCFPLAPACS